LHKQAWSGLRDVLVAGAIAALMPKWPLRSLARANREVVRPRRIVRHDSMNVDSFTLPARRRR
jgi:hypothetical protein